MPAMEGSDLVFGVTCDAAFDWKPEPSDEFAPPPGRRGRTAAADRRLRLRDEVEHPAAFYRLRLRRAASFRQRRRRRSCSRPRPTACFSATALAIPPCSPTPSTTRASWSKADVPVFGICLGPPDPVARDGRQNLQVEVRPPRRQPSGQGTRDRQGRDHVAEPRIRGRPRSRCQPTSRSRTSISTTAPSKGCGTTRSRSSACSTTPKPRPGPHDADYLFQQFIDEMEKRA